MEFNIDDYARPRDIGFRVEVHDPNSWLNNSTFRTGNSMVPRNPYRAPDACACRDHLNIRSRHPGPFISFFTTWHAALNKRRRLLDQGVTDVVIVAVWLKGLSEVYSAWDIAYVDEIRIPPGYRDVYQYEVLVLGGIPADSYRILAMFGGTGSVRDAFLSLEGFCASVQLPPCFLDRVEEIKEGRWKGRREATERLEEEIYSLTGTRNDDKFIRLVLSIGSSTYIA